MTFCERVTVLTCLSNWPVGHATNRSPTSSTAERAWAALPMERGCAEGEQSRWWERLQFRCSLVYAYIQSGLR